MASLKPGWTRVRFGEMVVSAGATRKARGWSANEAGVERYVGLEHLDSNSLKIRRWGSPDGVGQNSDLRLFEPGDVILARRGIELRKIGVAEFYGVASGHALVFRAKPQVVLPEFLPFFMQSAVFMDRADRFSVGSLSRTVNLSALIKEEFALPPLESQRRIAAVLKAAAEVANQLWEADNLGSRTRNSLIRHLFERGTRNEGLKNSIVGAIPSSWSVEPLGARFTVQLGKMMSEGARAGANSGTHIPYLRNANVQWNKLELDDVATMAFTAKEREKFALRPGDILACEGRHVGKSAIWRDEIPGACYQKALHRLRAKADDIPEFLLHCLCYCSLTGRFAALTGETTIPHLPAEKLREMDIAFPTSEEQYEIADAIDSFDRELSSLKRRAEQASLLIRSITAEAI